MDSFTLILCIELEVEVEVDVKSIKASERIKFKGL